MGGGRFEMDRVGQWARTLRNRPQCFRREFLAFDFLVPRALESDNQKDEQRQIDQTAPFQEDTLQSL